MTAYEQGLPVHVAYPKPPKMKNILGEFLSQRGLKQFRCAETEKYPHVTFFFNDYREPPFEGEDRFMIASPKVSTYDQMPEMSAYGICDEVIRRIDSKTYDLHRRELRQLRHGRPHGSVDCRGEGRRNRRRMRRQDPRPRSRSKTAPRSSPPITATANK